MKIVRIIARLNVGGPARHVVWLSAGLKDRGYETLLVAGVPPEGEDDMSYVAAAAAVQPLIIPEMSREISPLDLITAWKLYRLMLHERPRLVHTHTAKAGGVGRAAGIMYRWLTPSTLWGRPRQCRFVHTYHGHVFHSYYGPLKTKLFLLIEKMLARMTDRIIVISEQQRREINEDFHLGRREQFAVIPLGIDLDVYAEWQTRRAKLRGEISASDDDLLVGIVGRLTEVKNHRLFLEATALLKKMSTQRLKFLVIGDGARRSELESQARRVGIANDVVFLGTRDDPENFYPALDVVALTSLNEGTPLSVIEGMANRRPVIATGVGGVVDLLGQEVEGFDGYAICERGIRVRSGDAEGFANGVKRLIDDAALRDELGARGREFVLKDYSKERLLDDIANLYADLLGKKAPADSVVSRA
ncbi:MAG TPA: glycosyltransferase [Pyrinomonadaceae bacterium]|nr:glycosyltransferase [Pyrinomonadaceae bacterium]